MMALWLNLMPSFSLETGRNKHNAISKSFAPLAIGFAVFCAHAVLLPIDGCSINPARSLGPAIVTSTWPSNFWVFIVGPYIGAFCAIFPYLFFGWDFEIEKYQDPINIRTLDEADKEGFKKRFKVGGPDV